MAPYGELGAGAGGEGEGGGRGEELCGPSAILSSGPLIALQDKPAKQINRNKNAAQHHPF